MPILHRRIYSASSVKQKCISRASRSESESAQAYTRIKFLLGLYMGERRVSEMEDSSALHLQRPTSRWHYLLSAPDKVPVTLRSEWRTADFVRSIDCSFLYGEVVHFPVGCHLRIGSGRRARPGPESLCRIITRKNLGAVLPDTP